MDNNHLVLFSAGRSSAMLAKMVKEYYGLTFSVGVYSTKGKPDFYYHTNEDRSVKVIFCFANIGKERKETLAFANRVDKEFGLKLIWFEAVPNPLKGKGTEYRIVNFQTANRDGKVFESIIKKYGLPSKLYRHCTRVGKEEPINKFAKKFFGVKNYYTHLGMRFDEPTRISKDESKIYLLNNFKITEKHVREFFDKQSFDLQLKDYEGNCDLCHLKSKRKRMTLISETRSDCPPVWTWWNNMEQLYGTEFQPMFDVRNNLTIEQLVIEAKKPFVKILDKHDERKKQIQFDLDLDLETTDCFCASS